MQGDMNKIIQEVNVVLEGVFKRLEAIEEKLAKLEAQKVPMSKKAAA
jgi:hypothetical protein